jgi:hypothetical protein
MAWQLLYTSAPRLLDAGRTGFGTVARHRAVTGLLASSVERFSQFARLAGHDPKRVVYCHRVVIVGANKYHVLSCLRDAGSDYTGRTNHLAHHLIAEASEIAPLMAAGVTPVDVLQGMDWRTEWTAGARFLEPTEEIQLSLIRPHKARAWERLTGSQEYARLPGSPEAQRAGCYLIAPPTANILDLLGEALTEVSDQAWSTTFTTTLEPNDEVGDFRWIALPASSPLRAVTEGSPRIVFDLTAPATLPVPPPRWRGASVPKVPRHSIPAPSDSRNPGLSSHAEVPFNLRAPTLAPVEVPIGGRLHAAVPATLGPAGKRRALWSVATVAAGVVVFLIVFQKLGPTERLSDSPPASLGPVASPDAAITERAAIASTLRIAMKVDANIMDVPADQAEQEAMASAFKKWQKSCEAIDAVTIGSGAYIKAGDFLSCLEKFDDEEAAWGKIQSLCPEARRSGVSHSKIETNFYNLQMEAIAACKKATLSTDEDEKMWLEIFTYYQENKLFTPNKAPELGEALQAWVEAKGDETKLAGIKFQNSPPWMDVQIGDNRRPEKYKKSVLNVDSPGNLDVITYDWNSGQHDVYILMVEPDEIPRALTFVEYSLPEKLDANSMVVGSLDTTSASAMSRPLIPQKAGGYAGGKNRTPSEMIKIEKLKIIAIPDVFEYESSKGKKSESIKIKDNRLRIRMISQTAPCEVLIVPPQISQANKDKGLLNLLGNTQPILKLTEIHGSDGKKERFYDADLKNIFPERFKFYPQISSLFLYIKEKKYIEIKNSKIQINVYSNVKQLEIKLASLDAHIADPENFITRGSKEEKEINNIRSRIAMDSEKFDKIKQDRPDSKKAEATLNDIRKYTSQLTDILEKISAKAQESRPALLNEIDKAYQAWEASAVQGGLYQLRALVGTEVITLGQVAVNVVEAQIPE